MHPRIDALGVLLRQVRLADLHVRDRNAQGIFRRLIVHVGADLLHQLCALARDDVTGFNRTQNTAEAGFHVFLKLQFGALNVLNRLIEKQRIGNAVARKRIHHQPLLIIGDHFHVRKVQHKKLAGEDDCIFPGKFEFQARILILCDPGVFNRNGVAETQDQSLTVLIDDEHGRGCDEQTAYDQNNKSYRKKTAHCWSP